jgi:adenosylmethionine-8-amino-7-oxononanoate aminotransferase
MQDGFNMSFVLHRNLSSSLPVIVGGEGSYLIDNTGKRYLDACGGAAVSCLGHNHQVVRDAIKAQVDKLAFAHTGLFTNEPAEDLSEFLVSRAPKGTGHGRVMYLGSGSEAMEAALKLARQYHLERGEGSRSKVIARKPSYHGNTLSALATGGHAGRRAPFAPLLMDVAHIDAAYAYRLQKEGETEEDFALRMANLLETQILELGAGNVMAFVVEPVVGASLGTQTAPKGYFKRIRQICDQYGVLLIADEVMCGMGRTGSLFALEQEGICADLTTMAKGLGAGYQPIAAVLAIEKIINVIQAGSGKLWNGHTYMSHAIASAGALAVQKVIENDNLLDNVVKRGTQLELKLQQAFGGHNHIGDIRGRGLFWTIELVADKQTKMPFASHLGVAPNIQSKALDRGIMIYPSQGCADGVLGDHILLAPSYISTEAEIDLIVETLADAVNDVIEGLNGS